MDWKASAAPTKSALIDARAGYQLATVFDGRAIQVVAISSDVAGAILWRASGHPLVLRPYRPGEILRAIHQAMRGRSSGGPSPHYSYS